MINFQYSKELMNLIQLLILAMILSPVSMFSTEVIKQIICTKTFKSKVCVNISLIISIIFAFSITYTFGIGKMDIYDAFWLSYLLWLTSNGLFKYLEDKNAFIGKYVKSYSSYVNKNEKNNKFLDIIKQDEEYLNRGNGYDNNNRKR